MKKITLLFGLLLASQSWAQDCDALSYYNENFEATTVPAIPACAQTSGSNNNWVTVNNPGSGFESNALQYTGNSQTADAWYFTKGIAMTAGSWYKISYRYGNNSTTTTEDLTVTYGAATDNTGTVFQTHAGITGGTANTYNIDLFPAPGTGTYYFGFHATSAASQGKLYIDDIIIEPTTCNTPTGLVATDILTTSATMSWEATANNNNNSFSVYQYGYMTTNTPPSSSEDIKFSPATSVNLENLEPGTTYYLFVRAQCGPVYGDWSEAFVFTTPACTSTTVPYSLDFENATIPAMPVCTLAPDAVSGNEWVTANNPGSQFTNNTLVYTGTNETADAWFFTQGIELTAGTYYKVSYKYGNNSATTTENLRVTTSLNPNAAWITGTNFATHEGITGGTPSENSVEYFNVTESGIYYFGFNAYSIAGQGSIYVDDFKIELIDCGEPTNISATDITDTTATLSWSAATTGNATPSVYQYAISTTNTPPTESEYNPSTTVNLTELLPDTTYYVFVRVQCGPTWSGWETISFTTDEVAGINEHTFKSTAIYPNPVKDMLHLDASITIEKVEVYNITGQMVYTQNVNNQNASLNLQQLSAGAYLINIIGEGQSKRVKIIKQ